MQTFLPSQDFAECARVLDNRRLNKQITECKQIVATIFGGSSGWENHPAITMWRGYPLTLAGYGQSCYQEWMRRFDAGDRGGKREHKAGEWLREYPAITPLRLPKWFTPDVCSSYRALLLSKDPEWYGRFGWSEEPNADSKRIFEMIKEMSR